MHVEITWGAFKILPPQPIKSQCLRGGTRTSVYGGEADVEKQGSVH